MKLNPAEVFALAILAVIGIQTVISQCFVWASRVLPSKCSHLELRRQFIGNLSWYRCSTCLHKFSSKRLVTYSQRRLVSNVQEALSLLLDVSVGLPVLCVPLSTGPVYVHTVMAVLDVPPFPETEISPAAVVGLFWFSESLMRRGSELVKMAQHGPTETGRLLSGSYPELAANGWVGAGLEGREFDFYYVLRSS